MRQRYKKQFGLKQADLVKLFLGAGWSYDKIQEYIKAPRASIRGRKSELLNQKV